MKNWLIEKLGGVSKKDHEEVIQIAERLRITVTDYSQRISDGLKEKAEMRAEKAEIQRLRAELELLKRNKFKRGRK